MVALIAPCVFATTAAAGIASARTPRGTVIPVVAAENFWGSIAAQVGGSQVAVTSIIVNPNADPHSYEPTVGDAEKVAQARLVIVNGVGYDPWADRLVAADSSGPSVLEVGTLLHLRDGDNPHRWYSPADVQRMVTALTSAYSHIDPADRTYFARQARHFERVTLAPYHAAIAAIRQRYTGTAVGASESIFAMLSPALGLRLITPSTFLRAVSEGTDVSAADVETIDRQISHHEIAIYVYNSQNVTPEVQSQLSMARTAHIPVATITETLAPARATYQGWQTRQLEGIATALAASARRHR